MVDKVNAIVLSGGSAFGLEAATGTVRWLEEHGIGWPAGPSKVPIVPAAILFDLGVGGNPKIRPTADCGYKAAEVATAGPVTEGSVGAGAGATVGKFGGAGRSTKAGIGTASIRLASGLVVAALVAVNAVGDIIDPATGKVVAGVRNPDGTFADARVLLRRGASLQPPRAGENTTIGVVATNAKLTKALAARMSFGAVLLISAFSRCAASSDSTSARAASSSAPRIRRPFFGPSRTSAGFDPKNVGAPATKLPFTTVKCSET